MERLGCPLVPLVVPLLNGGAPGAAQPFNSSFGNAFSVSGAEFGMCLA